MAEQARSSHTIHITVKGGVIDYGGNQSLRVSRGDDVTLDYKGEFALNFGVNTPGDKDRYNGKDAIPVAISKAAKSGRYKYFVAVLHNGQILTDDPEMIVN